MTFSAFIPVALMDAANATLEAQGHGPGNFSVPVRNNGTTGDATHAALYHVGVDATFQAHVEAISGVLVNTATPGAKQFAAHCGARNLEWQDPTNWYQNPVMTGDQRVYGGKTWESLTDFNVWTPPVAWREVVSAGYPDWVQPVGAVDAYPIGARVRFNGQDWESLISANVWSPAVYPAGWRLV